MRFSSFSKNGFRSGVTLFEVVLVIGLLSAIFLWGSFLAVGFYRSLNLTGERDTVVAILRRARTHSLDNMNEKNHGMRVTTTTYVFFEGDSYASRTATLDETFPRASGLAASGLSEVIFGRLNGSSTVSGTISLTNGLKNATISVNYEGRITWQ